VKKIKIKTDAFALLADAAYGDWFPMVTGWAV
jgi:hypothetical protein